MKPRLRFNEALNTLGISSIYLLFTSICIYPASGATGTASQPQIAQLLETHNYVNQAVTSEQVKITYFECVQSLFSKVDRQNVSYNVLTSYISRSFQNDQDGDYIEIRTNRR